MAEEPTNNLDYEKIMKDYWKPRNEQLYRDLMNVRCESHSAKKGTKHQSRAKAKEEVRKEVNE
jgi:hypothetical protein